MLTLLVVVWCRCSYSENCDGCVLSDPEEVIEVTSKFRPDESDVSIAVVWADHEANFEQGRAAVNVVDDEASLGTKIGQKKDDALQLRDCIEAFTREETLSEEDPWYCSDCKEHRQANKKFDLWTLPDLVVIHLKRFSYTRTSRDKISTLVDFPLEGLDLSEFSPNPAYHGTGQAVYDLYAVSNHFGSLGGGHYTAYCKNLMNGEWFNHDDSSVSRASTDEIKSTAAYVLFYKRRSLEKKK